MISNPFKSTYLSALFLLFFSLISCAQEKSSKVVNINDKEIMTGAQQFGLYLNLLKAKNIAVVANQTSVIFRKPDYVHLVDSLLALNVTIAKVFSPEHGFRGKADASEYVADGIDKNTGLPIVSLYGKNRKPTAEQLENVDLVVFDIQDVGVRFYTYISTLHYVMEACAENNIPLLVLDRPNPNGHYVDGPTLDMAYKSFVGMHPVPLVYGMTIGEYAKMINGEGWLNGKIKCALTVVPLKNYTHQSSYSLPIRPSPNLPNDRAINLYPSLGFFEGTIINAGRGTENQFQQYGAPFFPKSDFSYTPMPNFGSKYPKYKDKVCYGVNLKNTTRLEQIDLTWLIDAYKKTPKSEQFFGTTFTQHAGNQELQKQLENEKTAAEIRESWQAGIERFQKIRKKYLIYK